MRHGVFPDLPGSQTLFMLQPGVRPTLLVYYQEISIAQILLMPLTRRNIQPIITIV